jgi:hypothetical protein
MYIKELSFRSVNMTIKQMKMKRHPIQMYLSKTDLSISVISYCGALLNLLLTINTRLKDEEHLEMHF